MPQAPVKGSSGWTDGERFSFLIKAIQQLQSNGAKLELSKLDMPGRTPKALSHILTKMKTEAAIYASAIDSSPTPVKTNTGVPPSDRKRIKEEVDESEDDDAGTLAKKPRTTTDIGKGKQSTAASGRNKGKTSSRLAFLPAVVSDSDPVAEPKLPSATMDQILEVVANAQVTAAAFDTGEV